MSEAKSTIGEEIKKLKVTPSGSPAVVNPIKRGIEVLEAQGCDARVLQMDGAKDPDEYIIKYGKAKFEELVNNAISLVEFKIKVLKQSYNLNNPTDKVKFLRGVTKLLAEIEDKIEREIYIEKVSFKYANHFF